jgi:glycosyltransferase involved in cell wall biosynthesis
MSEVCLIVPCYNEEKRLDLEAFALFLEEHKTFELLFVDDGSLDQTALKLEQFAKSSDRVALLILPRNAGKAEAVRQGVLKAIEKNSYEFIGYVDADLATPLGEMLSFVELLKNKYSYQIALGSRWKRLGANIDRKIMRHYLGRIFATVVSLIFNLNVYDTQCGAKLMRNQNLLKIFDTPFVSPWFFDIEILRRFQLYYPTVEVDQWAVEIPLQNWKEIGDSRIKTFDFVKAPFALLKIRNHYNRQKSTSTVFPIE